MFSTRFDIFNTGKISSEKSIIWAAVTWAAIEALA